MVLPPIFSGLPREATEIARDTWVAMDSCCRGQMGVEVSPNRHIRKSWFRQVSHSTHPRGSLPVGFDSLRKLVNYKSRLMIGNVRLVMTRKRRAYYSNT